MCARLQSLPCLILVPLAHMFYQAEEAGLCLKVAQMQASVNSLFLLPLVCDLIEAVLRSSKV